MCGRLQVRGAQAGRGKQMGRECRANGETDLSRQSIRECARSHVFIIWSPCHFSPCHFCHGSLIRSQGPGWLNASATMAHALWIRTRRMPSIQPQLTPLSLCQWSTFTQSHPKAWLEMILAISKNSLDSANSTIALFSSLCTGAFLWSKGGIKSFSLCQVGLTLQ